jgi:SAM-dependent methyltransferase
MGFLRNRISHEMRLFRHGIGPLQRISMFFRKLLQGRPRSYAMYLSYLSGKSGLEIGGPSPIFRKWNALPVYEAIGRLDNCDFSKSTAWAKHSDTFMFSPRKAPGSTYFCEGSVLTEIPDSTYDFLLSAHNLEHFANPIKALKEWQRVLKPGGVLILVLPHYRDTFDHKRQPTSVDHMFQDFEQNIGEEDLTHLPEILEKHDIKKDLYLDSLEQMQKRALDNLQHRCLHHHVFSEQNSRELLARVGFEVLAVDLRLPFHLCILARMI